MSRVIEKELYQGTQRTMDRQNHAGGCLYKAVVEAARQRGRRESGGGDEAEGRRDGDVRVREEREEDIYGTTLPMTLFF